MTKPTIARRVALVGNPNCGKTTLFNQLANANQRVGNWAGVTVERKSGYLHDDEYGHIELIDLPGTYSLTLVEELAEDEKITRDYLRKVHYDLIINVVDALSLERNLYLTIQLLELGIPVIVVLNRLGKISHNELNFKLKKLIQALRCPVMAITELNQNGLALLKKQIFAPLPKIDTKPLQYHLVIEREINTIANELKKTSCLINSNALRHQAITLLEGENHNSALILSARERVYQEIGNEADVIIASQRYQFIENHCISNNDKTSKKWSARLDNILLNRFLGLPLFCLSMYLMFLFAVNIGGAFQDSIDIASNALFVDGMAIWLEKLSIPSPIISVVAYGIGKGINTTLTFTPVLGAMFLALTFLEDCGFMARAAFIMDRLMRALGLPGKAFVPMIVGFGCNVPAILGARHLENKRDRILTIMMSPFMSCGARLAIFTVFVATFFPKGGQNWVFTLYFVGIVMAIFTGMLLKKTILKGPSAPLILEMPDYQFPIIKNLFRHTWHRLSKFIFNAGKLIILVCTLLGALNALHINNDHRGSLLEEMSVKATPLFEPMGINEQNWPATVALFTGLLAKEVVIGTLNTLYQQAAGELPNNEEDAWSLKDELRDALNSVSSNLKDLGSAIINPIAASAPDENLTLKASSSMKDRFDGKAGAFSYLLFVLLYFPCVSAVSAIAKESSKKWAFFSVAWTTGLAYFIAVMFYQIATFAQHPAQTIQWFYISCGFVISVFLILKWIAIKENKRRSLPTPILVNVC